VLSLADALGKDKKAAVQLTGLRGAQTAFVMAALMRLMPEKNHLFIAESKENAAYRLNDLEGLTEGNAYFFPDSFKRPAFFDDLNPNQMLQRSELVSKLTGGGTLATGKAIFSYPEALFEKVVKPEVLNQSRIDVKKGEKLDLDFVIQVLVEYGFERTDFVFEPGQFSIRGGIIDLFSFGNEYPYRLEMFDDEVETIRTFDPSTQLSRQSISALSIVPNLSTKFRQDQKVSLISILPENTVVWVSDQQHLLDRLQFCFDQAEKFAAKLTALDSADIREIFRDRAFLYPTEITQDLEGRATVLF
jgi:transcription-repair coupling factor (superfamily II helicase)